MFSKKIISLIQNKIMPTIERSITGIPPGTGTAVNGLILQVQKGSEELEENLDFLECTFARDDPVVASLRLEETCDLMRYVKTTMCQSYVVKLVNEDCEIISAAVCTPTSPSTADKMRTFAECSICCPKTKRLINLWADVADSHNLYECFKVKELWNVTFLATAAAAAGKVHGNVVLAESKVIGKKVKVMLNQENQEEGFSIIRMDCTSYQAAKLAESLKFVTLPPRNILTFRDKRGCPWLSKSPPHPNGNAVVTYDFLC